MSLGDLTVAQLLKKRGTTVKKHMTVADFISAVQKLGPILAQYFPPLAALIAALKALNALLEQAAKLYADAVALYQKLRKTKEVVQSPLPIVGDGGATAAQQAAKETQKTLMNQASAAVQSAYNSAKDKVLNTPIRTLSGGAIP